MDGELCDVELAVLMYDCTHSFVAHVSLLRSRYNDHHFHYGTIGTPYYVQLASF